MTLAEIKYLILIFKNHSVFHTLSHLRNKGHDKVEHHHLGAQRFLPDARYTRKFPQCGWPKTDSHEKKEMPNSKKKKKRKSNF